MYKYLLFLSLLASTSVGFAEPPPVNNAIPPCENSSIEGKPPCSIDSNGVITAPKTPDETNGAIITPEKPTEGLPDRTQNPGGDIVTEPKLKNKKK